jgi:multiple sugar transport system ATP-binding protein
MNNGNIEQTGAPLELYDRPENLFVAGFIGSPAMNLLPGSTGEGGFIADGGAKLPMPPTARNGAGYYGIRPEHLRLTTAGEGIPATVQIIEPTGSETQVMLRIGETPLTGAFRERVTAKPGEIIHIAPDLNLIHLFEKGSGQRIAS